MHLSQQAGVTNVGRVRKNNEDVFAIRPEIGLALVCDGMGGAACGEVASGMAAKAVCDYFDLTRGQPASRRIRVSSASCAKLSSGTSASAAGAIASAPSISPAARSTDRQRAWAYCT